MRLPTRRVALARAVQKQASAQVITGELIIKNVRTAATYVIALLGMIMLLLAPMTSSALAEAGSEHDWPNATHNDQCIKLANNSAVLRDVEGNPLKNAETSSLTVSASEKSETCSAAQKKGVQINGIESIKTGSGLTLYYEWSGAHNTTQESGFIAASALAKTPNLDRADSGENKETKEYNGEPAPLAPGEPQYRLTPSAIPELQGYFGGSTWYSYEVYGLPGCCDSHFAVMTWSWIDVSGGGITRANVAEGASFYPSSVPYKRLTSYNPSHEATGEVTAVYGRVSSGSESIWGWIVARSTYDLTGSESGCRNHMEYAGGGPGVNGLLCDGQGGGGGGNGAASSSSRNVLIGTAGQRYIYYVGANKQIWEEYYPGSGSTWSDSQITHSESAASGASPTALMNTSGNRFVYYVGVDKQIWEAFYNGTSWSDAQITGGEPVATGAGPTALMNSAGDRFVYYVGENNQIWEDFYNGTSWSNDLPVSGESAASGAAPTALMNSAGDRFVYYVGANRQVWEEFYPGSGSTWSDAEITAGEPAASGFGPSAVMNSAGDRFVYYVGENNQYWEDFYNGTSWSQDLPVTGEAVNTGEPPGSGPSQAALMNAAGDRFAYYVGANSQIWEDFYNGTAWSNDLPVTGEQASAGARVYPTALADAAGHRFVYYIGADNQVFEEFYAGGSSWSDSLIVAGESAEAGTSPTALKDAARNRFIYFVGADRQIWEDFYNGTSWSQDLPTTGEAVASGTSPTALMDSAGHRFVYYVGANGQIWEEYYAGGSSWSDSQITSGEPALSGTSPTALKDADGHRFVYYVRANHQIWEAFYPGSGTTWSDSQITSGEPTATSPSVTALIDADGHRFVYYVGEDNQIWEDFYSGTSWSNDLPVSGESSASGTGVAALIDGAGRRYVYYVGTNNQIWEEFYPGSGSTWSDSQITDGETARL